MNDYSIKLRQEKKEKLASRISLKADTEVFNLKKLKSALENIKDVIDALDDDPPKVASALSNARSVKKSVESQIDAYPDSSSRRRVVVVENPPPPPPPPAASANLAAGTVEFNLRSLKRALRNIDDVIEALEADTPRIKSALSNAEDVKDAIEDAIDTYDDGKDYGPRYRRISVVSPPPPPPPGPGMQNEGSVELAEKTEDGKKFPKEAYAYTPSDFPGSWKLRLWATPDGGPDARIVGAAVAALGKGFRGNKVQIPIEDLPGVKAKVRAAWVKANPDKDKDELPEVIQASGAIELVAETEEFNLKHLKTALTNINDTIDALESDPPKVGSALSNAKTTKTAIEKAIDTYDDGGRPRRRRIYIPVPPPPPPPPAP